MWYCHDPEGKLPTPPPSDLKVKLWCHNMMLWYDDMIMSHSEDSDLKQKKIKNNQIHDLEIIQPSGSNILGLLRNVFGLDQRIGLWHKIKISKNEHYIYLQGVICHHIHKLLLESR